MHIELGFAVISHCDVCPAVTVRLDHDVLIRDRSLSDAGSAQDDRAELHWLSLHTDLEPGEHELTIQESNISDSHKQQGDFGWQLRSIVMQGIDLEYFGKPLISRNPIPNQHYVDQYLAPNGFLHEIEQGVHVRRGRHADFVNMPGGSITLMFMTPLYTWWLQDNFGHMTSSMIRAWNDS